MVDNTLFIIVAGVAGSLWALSMSLGFVVLKQVNDNARRQDETIEKVSGALEEHKIDKDVHVDATMKLKIEKALCNGG